MKQHRRGGFLTRPDPSGALASNSRALLLALTLLLLFSSSARAADQLKRPSILDGVGIDQNLGAQISPDLVFRDEAGRDVRLGEYFGKKPLILALVYYKCPMLCTLVLNDLTRGLSAMPLNVGEQFDVLTISFDPSEKPQLAAEKKKQYLREYHRPNAANGWHFLTGDQASIDQLTRTVGFHYTWDPKFKQYVHASGLTVLTPDGKISRYFFGIGYSATDMRLSLVEASGAKIATPTDQVLLYCLHYDPATGRYSLAITRVLRVAAILTVTMIASFMLFSWRRERLARVAASAPTKTESSAAS